MSHIIKKQLSIVNTLFFVLWIMTCGMLVSDSKEKIVFRILLFILLFWFLCPAPSLTLFWTAASTTYLWANTLAFIFLLFFQKYKDDDFSVMGKLGLFIVSFFAATEFITCVSICGAFVVYYASHINKFKGNVVPFVVGFVIGSLALLLAPGNYSRVANGIGMDHPLFDIRYVLHHLVQEMAKYKTLWAFLFVVIWGWVNNKIVVKSWIIKNSILILSIGWSVIAFSVVFLPGIHALFFTESLSLVLLLRFFCDNYGILKIGFVDGFMKRKLSITKIVIMNLLFVLFLVDSVFAINETKRQRKNNDVLLKEIVDSGGILAMDRIVSTHRMAYVPRFPDWTYKPLTEKYNLDSIHFYPSYCLEKYYNQDAPLDNIYIADYRFIGDDALIMKDVRIIVRIKNEMLQKPNNHVVFTIDYTRPRKWYKSWMDKLRNYQYERTAVVEIDEPEVCFDGYCYYIIWFDKENVKGLKSIKYEIE